MCHTRVVHCKQESYDILIDRTTEFGNPFTIVRDGTREEVIKKHEDWLFRWIQDKEEIVINGFSNKWVIEHLFELKGKVLGCWCFPRLCHGNILIDLIEIFYGN